MTTERRERKKDPDAETIKTTVLLPRAVWREAKIRAMDDGTDLNRVLVAALKAYLRTQRAS